MSLLTKQIEVLLTVKGDVPNSKVIKWKKYTGVFNVIISYFKSLVVDNRPKKKKQKTKGYMNEPFLKKKHDVRNN